MKNQEEIKEVKDQMRELADRLEALEQETPKREPQATDVWTNANSGRHFIIDDEGVSDLGLDGSGCVRMETDFRFGRTDTYLGKAADVLMLRSDVEKDYVSKETILELAKDYHPSGVGYCVIMGLVNR